MAKAKSREIPYRVYKKMFSDCNAYDYQNGKITVDFPVDYLESKMYIPDGWYSGANYVSKRIGRTTAGREVRAEIAAFGRRLQVLRRRCDGREHVLRRLYADTGLYTLVRRRHRVGS